MSRSKEVQVVVAEYETEHVHEGEETLCCERCHKKIGQMATFFRWRGLVIGPECIVGAKKDGAKVRKNKLVEVIREKFLLQKKADTIRGMKAKGML